MLCSELSSAPIRCRSSMLASSPASDAAVLGAAELQQALSLAHIHILE